MLINSLRKLKSLGFQPINILDKGVNKGQYSILVKKKVFPLANYNLIETIDYDELGSINNILYFYWITLSFIIIIRIKICIFF